VDSLTEIILTYTLTHWQDCCLEIHRVGGEEMVVRVWVHEKRHPFSCYVDCEYVTKLLDLRGYRNGESKGMGLGQACGWRGIEAVGGGGGKKGRGKGRGKEGGGRREGTGNECNLPQVPYHEFP
jgi:hypothetical protein